MFIFVFFVFGRLRAQCTAQSKNPFIICVYPNGMEQSEYFMSVRAVREGVNPDGLTRITISDSISFFVIRLSPRF